MGRVGICQGTRKANRNIGPKRVGLNPQAPLSQIQVDQSSQYTHDHQNRAIGVLKAQLWVINFF